MLRNTTAVVLAGGKGTRLEPLTLDRAKPAVPFGGNYRIIDFVLSNAINSGLRRLLVLTQYKALSLDRHINLGWRQYFAAELGEFLDVVPPQQRIDEQCTISSSSSRLLRHHCCHCGGLLSPQRPIITTIVTSCLHRPSSPPPLQLLHRRDKREFGASGDVLCPPEIS